MVDAAEEEVSKRRGAEGPGWGNLEGGADQQRLDLIQFLEEERTEEAKNGRTLYIERDVGEEEGRYKGQSNTKQRKKEERTDPGPVVLKERLHRPTRRKKTHRRPGIEVGQQLAGRPVAVGVVRAFRLEWALKQEERARAGEAESEGKQHYSPVKVFCAPGGLTRTEKKEEKEDWEEEERRKRESQEAAETAQDRSPE